MGIIIVQSLFSGLSTPLGAAIVLSVSSLAQPVLSFILALASGVMLTVVATELMPNSLHIGGLWWFILGAISGILLMSWLRELFRSPKRLSAEDLTASERLNRTGQAIALAIAVHDLPEGMAIGAGDLVHAQLGMVLALAIALHNLPEGMSIAAPLAMGGTPRKKILLLTLAISLVTPLGTVLSLVLGSLSPAFHSVILALASGAMIYVVVHDTLPESWNAGKGGLGLGLAAGIALMLALAHIHGALATSMLRA
jgi:ZIP family zinc transporter